MTLALDDREEHRVAVKHRPRKGPLDDFGSQWLMIEGTLSLVGLGLLGWRERWERKAMLMEQRRKVSFGNGALPHLLSTLDRTTPMIMLGKTKEDQLPYDGVIEGHELYALPNFVSDRHYCVLLHVALDYNCAGLQTLAAE
jgi:hypothetical protein